MPSHQRPTYGELEQQNKTLVEKVQKQEKIQSILLAQLNLANALNNTGNLEEGLTLCLDTAIEASELDCGGIYLFDDISGDLKMIVHKGLAREFVNAVSTYGPDSENVKLVLKGEPCYASCRGLGKPLNEIARKMNLNALGVVPIRHKDNIIGCINVGSHTLKNIPEISRISLEMIAMQLGAAIAKLKSETALRESEERYRISIEHSLSGIALSEKGRYFFINNAYRKMFGYEHDDEILGKEITLTVHPEDKERVWRIYNLRLQDKEAPEIYEFKGIRKDGTHNYIEITAKKINYKGRSLILAFFRDITEKKKAVEGQKKSEQKFKAFFEGLPIGAAMSSNYHEPMTVNQALADMVGYSKDELQSGSTIDTGKMITHPEDFQKESQYIKQIESREIPGYRMEKRFIKKNGEILYGDVSTSIVFDEENDGILGISCIRDITRRKKAEQALKESQERYAALFDRSFDCIYLHDFEGNYIDCNDAFLELTGYTKEELSRLNPSDLISPDQMAQAAESINTILRQGSEEQLTAYKIRTKNNEIKDFEVRGTLICRDGKPYAILGIGRDVTERKQNEDRLQLQAMLADQITDIITITDMAGKIVYINEAGKKILERDMDELEESTVHIFGEDPAEGASQQEIIENTIKKGGWQGIVVNFDKHGKKHVLDCRTFIVRDENGNPAAMCGISTDITEKKRLEDQLRQSQKLEAVGTLAGGIAHDFNNILGIILGNAELAKLCMAEENSRIENNVDQIIETCLRGKQVIRQLLDFSRQAEQTKFSLTLGPLIKESIKMLRPLIPANIDIRQSFKDDTAKALVDPAQVHQIIINLCTNAYQAMSERGGTIDIAHDTVIINSKTTDQFEKLEPGRYIRLRISDTGAGIAPENLGRIFDPYFTTKESGTGTGLGLSVVHGIVKNLKGAVTVSSKLSKGTTFTILIPVTDAETEKDILSESTELPVGKERVLFVDDERHLAIIGRDMLEELGYHASFANSSTEAIDMISSRPDQFDLVITDMAMPHMTGIEMAWEIFKIRPDMPMILCTGHNKDIDEEKAKKMGFKAFLMKPVNMNLLAFAVRRVLDNKAAIKSGT